MQKTEVMINNTTNKYLKKTSNSFFFIQIPLNSSNYLCVTLNFINS